MGAGTQITPYLTGKGPSECPTEDALTHNQLHPQIAQWTVQALTRLLATFAIIQGVAIVVGGPGRWRGPSFTTALSVPGAPASWGIVLGVLGTVALLGTFTRHHTATGIAAIGIGAWSMFFATSFVITAARYEGAATTGIFTYGQLCVASVVLGVAYAKSGR